MDYIFQFIQKLGEYLSSVLRLDKSIEIIIGEPNGEALEISNYISCVSDCLRLWEETDTYDILNIDKFGYELSLELNKRDTAGQIELYKILRSAVRVQLITFNSKLKTEGFLKYTITDKITTKELADDVRRKLNGLQQLVE